MTNLSRLIFATLVLLGSVVAFAAPSNDNFASARTLSNNTGTTTGTNVEATFQFDDEELDHAGDGAGQSVWFRWTAPNDGLYSFNTQGSDFDTVLAVYTGTSLVTLIEEASAHGEIAFGNPARVYFTAVAGTTYRIALDGWFADTNFEGLYRLSWLKVPPPANDNFANGIVLSGRSGSVNASNREGTKEANEDGDPSGASIWYRFSAPESGFLRLLDGESTSVFPVFTVYTGADLNSLTEVVTENLDGRYVVDPGTVYHIMVEGDLPGEEGDIEFDFTFTPANDIFENAKNLSGTSGTIQDDNGGATLELGEPPHAGGNGGYSLWFRWTAPASGQVRFSAETIPGPGYTDALAVYTGSVIATLTPVESGLSSPLVFNAVVGTEYKIAVDTDSANSPGAFKLSWLQIAPPSNDNLANALILGGNSGQVSALLLGATRESAEILHFQFIESPSNVSVWYRWAAPADGVFVFRKTDLLASGRLHQVEGSGNDPFRPLTNGSDTSLVVGASAGQTLTFRVSENPLLTPQVGITYTFHQNASAFRIGATPRLRERLAESGALTVSRYAGDLSQTAVVTLAPISGTGFAAVGTDFSLSQTMLTFAPNETEKTITVIAVNNATSTGNKKLSFSLTAGPNAIFNGEVSTGEIVDDDDDPANNVIGNATTLSGQSGTAVGTTVGADRDETDPGYSPAPSVLAGASSRTVWFKWTAPVTGPVKFSAESDYAYPDMLFAAFDGSGANAVTLSDSIFGIIGWAATAGQTYHIAVALDALDPDTYEAFDGAGFSLSWRYITAGIVNISSATTVLEGPGANVTLTLTRTGGTAAFQVKALTTLDQTAEPNVDFTSASRTVQFAIGETTKTVNFTILDDAEIEEPETFGVTLDATSNEVFVGKDAVVTIQDDDGGSALSFAAKTTEIPEDGGPVLLTVVRNGIQTGVASVGYIVSAGTASGADVNLASGTVTFADGQASNVISIPIINDTVDEPVEYFTATLANPGVATTIATNSSVRVDILDDDVPGVLALSAATLSATENAPTVDLTVVRANGTDGVVSATFSVASGTATAGADFLTLTGSVTLVDGETSKTFSVALLDDFLDEPNETFTVTLSAPTAGSSLGAQRSATVTLTDDDIPGVLAFSGASFSGGESAPATAVLTILRTLGDDGPVSVHFTVTAGSAQDGTDFTISSGTVNFAHLDVSKTLTIPLVNDQYVEVSESFTVTLDTPTGGATLGTQTSATVTIADDDAYVAKKTAYSASLVRDGLVEGGVSLMTTAAGKVTAVALLGGAKNTFKGLMNVDGSATLLLKKKGFPDQTLTLRLGGDVFEGTLDDGLGNVFTFGGNENANGSKIAPVSDAGKFTALVKTRPALNGGLLAFGFPQGDGWLDITVAPTGKIKLKGKLGDGTSVSFSGALDAAGGIPVYIPIYAAKQGFIGFTLEFDSAQPQTDAAATSVRWVKPRAPNDKVYPRGWPGGITADIAASKLVPPAKVTPKNPLPPYILGTHNMLGLVAPTGMTAAFAGLSSDASVDAKSKVSVTPSAAKLAVTLKPSGAFSGSFVHPANGKPAKFSGVILQKSHRAGGFFIDPDNTSADVTLTPKP